MMKSFLKYIEEAIQFQKGKDQDYLSGLYTVIFFSQSGPNEYKQTGKTHGIESHALKHLKEFKPSVVTQLLGETKDIIKKSVKDGTCKFVGLYKRNGKWLSTDVDEIFTRVSDKALINTLDVINDKVIKKDHLLPIEQKLNGILTKFEEVYQKEIELRLKKAYDLSTLKTEEEIKNVISKNPIIKFDGSDKGVEKVYCLGMKDSAMIILSDNGTVRTMYKITKNPVPRKDVISTFFRKMGSIVFKSKLIRDTMEKYMNGE